MTDEQHSGTDDARLPIEKLIRTRHEKAEALRASGIDPFPYRFERSHTVASVVASFESLSSDESDVAIAGRVMTIRKMGKVYFADIADMTGRIQIYLRKEDVGAEAFERFSLIDMGDILGVHGTVFITKTGEQTIAVQTFELLTKAYHPLPDKHAGLTDKEMRYRRRYVDLIANPEVRETFIKRSRIIQAIREFLNDNGFLEVETPILQPLYGGAAARPFVTHHNTLDIEMYLRIADELYLKRLVVGGYDKVWELCKDFRNEGMDRLHNPEFTMIELYWAYADYRDMAALFERLLRYTVHDLYGRYTVTYGDHEIDFEPPFRWVSMIDSIRETTNIDFTDLEFDDALTEARRLDIETDGLINRGKVIEAVWETKVEPTLIQPTFITDFPVEISPLAKRHRDDPRLTERFELFIAGQETGNAFSELNDPLDQLGRFLQQGKAMEAGDEEAQPLDDDFITALAYGMPPTAGLGFGVDRLVMLLTNQHSIRDVLFFPQMKEMKEGTTPVSQMLSPLLEDSQNREVQTDGVPADFLENLTLLALARAGTKVHPTVLRDFWDSQAVQLLREEGHGNLLDDLGNIVKTAADDSAGKKQKKAVAKLPKLFQLLTELLQVTTDPDQLLVAWRAGKDALPNLEAAVARAREALG